MFESISMQNSGDSEEGKKVGEAVAALRAAIAEYIGRECDVAIGVHLQHESADKCSALVITQEGMSLEFAARIMWMGLAGLQMILAEMPEPPGPGNNTIN